METHQAGTAPTIHRVQFSGTASEYFKIWIVNICLTIVTLGIYSAWAKVRTLQYFYGSTTLGGHAFAYLADPIKILKGRIVAVALLIAYTLTSNFYPTLALWMLAGIVLLIPFVIVTASSFTLRNSAYRSVRFQFRRDIASAYRAFLLPLALGCGIVASFYWLLDTSGTFAELEQSEGGEAARVDMVVGLSVFAFLPVLPWLDYIRSKLMVSNAGFGQLRAAFSAGLWSFYAIYLVMFAIFVGLVFAMGISLAIVIGITGPPDSGTVSTPLIVTVILFYASMFLAMAYLQARRRNLVFGGTTFGRNRIISEVQVIGLGWIYVSNTVAIIVSVGLLIPWASIRLAKYLAYWTQVELVDIPSVLAERTPDQAAFGEEFGDAFDIDLGI